MNHGFRLICFCLMIAVGAGCSNRELLKAQEAYRQGNLVEANEQIASYIDGSGDGVDRVIAHLEWGNIARAGNDFETSNYAFQLADEAIDQIDEEADISVSDEGVALLTNMNALPYRGKNYDRVMLSTYRALNFMQMGDIDAARVELRKAYQRQVEAVERNAERIEEAKEEAELAKQDGGEERPAYDADRAQEDERFQEGFAEHYSDLDQYQAYADYVNPFSEFLQGIYFMSTAVDGDDAERARKSLERVSGMVPTNDWLKADLALANRVASGARVEPVTYVVFETGTAPERKQIRIDIPLFLLTNEVDYVGANFPRLSENDLYVPSLTVEGAGQTVQTQLLSDIDSIVGQEFRNELPIIITKTLIASGTKAAIAYALKEATEGQNAWVAIGTRVATTIYQAATNEADLRTWATLPKQVHYARLATPEDGRLVLSCSGVHAPVTVDVMPGAVNIVLVRSINPATPMQVSQFPLTGGRTQ